MQTFLIMWMCISTGFYKLTPSISKLSYMYHALSLYPTAHFDIRRFIGFPRQNCFARKCLISIWCDCPFWFIVHLNSIRRVTQKTLRWRRNGCDSVSNHQPHYCLLKGFLGFRSKKTWKLCVTGLCAGNSPGTGEFLAQMASNAENVSIWWRHHGTSKLDQHSTAVQIMTGGLDTKPLLELMLTYCQLNPYEQTSATF